MEQGVASPLAKPHQPLPPDTGTGNSRGCEMCNIQSLTGTCHRCHHPVQCPWNCLFQCQCLWSWRVNSALELQPKAQGSLSLGPRCPFLWEGPDQKGVGAAILGPCHDCLGRPLPAPVSLELWAPWLAQP